MEAISLLPREIKEKEQRKRFVFNIIMIIVLTLFTYGGAYLILSSAINDVNMQIEKIQTKRETMEEGITRLEPYREFQKKIASYESILEESVGDMPRWELVMRDVSGTIPGEVWLLDFYMTYEGGVEADNNENEEDGNVGELNMTGYAYEHDDVAIWLGRLNNNPELRDVNLEYSIMTEREGREVVEFYVTAGVVPREFVSPLERKGLTSE